MPTAIPSSLPTRHSPTTATLSSAVATPLQYRLDVLAPSALDAVTSAGGWMFDRVLAGWHVHVALADEDGSQALRILGVTVGGLRAYLASASPQVKERAHAIAVSAELCRLDPSVSDTVARLAHHNRTEVTLFGGDEARTTSPLPLHPARHQLTAAARAFKGRALVAAGGHGAVAATELFSCGSLRHIDEERDLTAISRPRPVSADTFDADASQVPLG